MSQEYHPKERRFAAFKPVEQSMDAHGRESILFHAVGTDPEIIARAADELTEALGGGTMKMVQDSQEMSAEDRSNSSKSFGFTRWNSPWQPKGPTPNWQVSTKPESNGDTNFSAS